MSSRLALALAVILSGCLAPREPAAPRYFSPVVAAVDGDPAGRAESTGPELRLRRVTAADYLRRRMVWRRGTEVGFYDLLRWTESPASYVETRLAQALFEEGDLRRVTRPGVASLSVQLLAFDEVLEPVHEAVVELSALLVDRSQVADFNRTFRSSRPVTGDAPDDIARALGEALSEVVTEVGDAVESALAARVR